MKNITLCLVLLYGCSRTDIHPINLNGNRIDIIGHGGMGIFSLYPMNSAESILMAVSSGADGVEMDCELLADGKFVVFHDEILSELTWYSGKIYDMNSSSISQVLYKDPPLGNYHLVLLEDMLQALHPSDPLVTLDLKTFSPDTSDAYVSNYCVRLIHLLKKYPFSKVNIESKNEKFIRKFNQADSALRLFWSGSADHAFDVAARHHLYGITYNFQDCEQEWIDQAHARGLRVALWNTQSKKDNLNAIEMNPDFIQTDRLRTLQNLLR